MLSEGVAQFELEKEDARHIFPAGTTSGEGRTTTKRAVRCLALVLPVDLWYGPMYLFLLRSIYVLGWTLQPDFERLLPEMYE